MTGRKRKRGETEEMERKRGVEAHQSVERLSFKSLLWMTWSLYCWGPPWSFHVKPYFLKRGKWDTTLSF